MPNMFASTETLGTFQAKSSTTDAEDAELEVITIQNDALGRPS